jgi:hypothetical protein
MNMARVFRAEGTETREGDETVTAGWYYQLNLDPPVGPFDTQIDAGKAARATIVDLAEPEPDTSDIPEAGEEWFKKATRIDPEPPTRSYLVRWEIDVEATSPLDAAEKARAYQVKKGTTATVFDVFEKGDHPSDTMRVAHIDLTFPDESEFVSARGGLPIVEHNTDNNR